MIKKDMSRKKLWAKRYDDGLCIYCGKQYHMANKKGCQECLKKKVIINNKYAKNNKEKSYQYRLLRKYEVIKKYGGKCACCGESEMLFLTIDHINNDGKKDRKTTMSWYLKLKREPIRDDLQVLCFNCNMAKSINGGECPHKKINRKLDSIYDKRHDPQFDTRLKISWPNDNELIKMCNETSITQVSKKLGVDFSAVSGRLKRRGLYDLVKKRTGGIKNGEENKSSKLTKDIVVDIRKKAELGLSRKEIAFEYNISKSLVDKIVNFQLWKVA